MMRTPLLSVIMPVHQGASVLQRSLTALEASDLLRAHWELIVVDDASTDGSAEIAARHANQVIKIPSPARGPAFSRNRGAERAIGDWLVFVDADVVVHRDTLSQIAQITVREPTIDGIVGAYDDQPEAPGLLSQYRNLLHRYTHLRAEASGGDADTFWAGCGAVRRSAFVAVGGFDESRYRRPQIEDIEVGYRLRDRGHRIVHRGAVQGTHLKRWTFVSSVRTDLFDRGIPWVRLLLERRNLLETSTLNLQRGERLKTALVGVGFVFLATALLRQSIVVGAAGAVCVAGVMASNTPQIVWFARQRGIRFALFALPMIVWYYVVALGSVVMGTFSSLFASRNPVPHQPSLRGLRNAPEDRQMSNAVEPSESTSEAC